MLLQEEYAIPTALSDSEPGVISMHLLSTYK